MNGFNSKIIEDIKVKIKDQNKVVIVPEGSEDRVIKSLKYTPDIIKKLVGKEEEIKRKIEEEYKEQASTIMEKVIIVDEKDYVTEERVLSLIQKRKNKVDEEEAKELLSHRNYVATMMLECNKADALVGGSYYSTADILRPAFQIIKPKPGTSTVSSFFMMQKDRDLKLFADCAININPTEEQLAEIAYQSIISAKELGMDPKVVFLSFSTKGSGKGEEVDKVREAYNTFVEKYPEFKDIVDGESQFDAAYNPKVGKIKAPNSNIIGDANVFIFPNLESGNIGYKIAEQMGGWEAIGPLLQGLNKPVNDLSRGTTPETIAKVMYLSLR